MRFFAVMSVLVGVLVFGLAPGAGAAPSLTTVCHVDDDGVVIPIAVADRAVPAHLAHGDALPGDPVPDTVDYVFDETCAPVFADGDGDGVGDSIDNCPAVPNADQLNHYGSSNGDVCEDFDGDGTLDVNEPNMCVSVNGVVILNSGGSAGCSSTPTTGADPNIAIASGFSLAQASNGDGNTATASGDSSFASAGSGDGNTATASGFSSFAFASNGNDNTATASGDNSLASATAPAGCMIEATDLDPFVTCS